MHRLIAYIFNAVVRVLETEGKMIYFSFFPTAAAAPELFLLASKAFCHCSTHWTMLSREVTRGREASAASGLLFCCKRRSSNGQGNGAQSFGRDEKIPSFSLAAHPTRFS